VDVTVEQPGLAGAGRAGEEDVFAELEQVERFLLFHAGFLSPWSGLRVARDVTRRAGQGIPYSGLRPVRKRRRRKWRCALRAAWGGGSCAAGMSPRVRMPIIGCGAASSTPFSRPSWRSPT